MELKKVHYFFEALSIESIRLNSFKVYKFLKTGVHGKFILISSRGKVTWISLFKSDIDIINQEFFFDFVLWNCPSDIIHLISGA